MATDETDEVAHPTEAKSGDDTQPIAKKKSSKKKSEVAEKPESEPEPEPVQEITCQHCDTKTPKDKLISDVTFGPLYCPSCRQAAFKIPVLTPKEKKLQEPQNTSENVKCYCGWAGKRADLTMDPSLNRPTYCPSCRRMDQLNPA